MAVDKFGITIAGTSDNEKDKYGISVAPKTNITTSEPKKSKGVLDYVKTYAPKVKDYMTWLTNPTQALFNAGANRTIKNVKNAVNAVKDGNIKLLTGTDNFKDGWQAGDVLKTAGSTGVNALKLFGTGAMKSMEGVVDTGATVGNVISKGASLLTNKNSDYGKAVRENIGNVEKFIARDLTGEALDFYGWNDKLNNGKTVSQTIDNSSLITNQDLIGKGAEAIGGMAPTILTGGTSKILNSVNFGSKVMGNAVEEALQNGADFNKAVMYGIGSTAVEIGSEWLTGGIPGLKGTSGGGLDKLASKLIGENIDEASSTLAKAILKAGYKAIGEAGEEALAEVLAPYLKQFTYEYNKEKNILGNLKEGTSKIDINSVIESAIVGAITGGVLNLPMTVSDISQVGKNVNSNIDTSPAGFNQALVNNKVDENITEDETKPVLNTQPILETNTPQDIQKQIIENTASLENLQKIRENTLTTIEQKNIDKQINELQTKISALETHLEQNNTVDIKPLEIPKIDTEIDSNIELNQELENSSFSLKQKQNDIIQNSNPAEDDLHTWIRNVDDIKTFEETLNDDSYKEYYDAGEDFDPSYTADMAKEALNTGKITVYSSYPIKDGIFVSPSKMEAESYSGSGKVYSKLVNLTDVAWIDPTQGQYAKTNSEIKFSKGNIPINNKLLNKYDSVNEIFANEKTNYDKKVRSWSETITESDGLDQKIVEEAMKGQDFTYIPDSNKKQWEYATNKIEMVGYKQAINDFNAIVDSGKSFSANDLALGQKLLQEASNKKDIQTFKDLLPKITIIGTELGQAVQSLSIIKKMSPEGQLKYLQQTVEHMKKRNIKGAEKIVITDKMVETILNSKGTEELTNNIDKVKDEISRQLPSTFKEKIVAWRYLSMLGNLRTHIRNIVSNTAMKGTQGIKNTIAKTIETVVNPIIKKSGQERTKTLKKSSKVVKEYVKNYSQKAVGDLNNTSKYSMELEIKRAKKVFGDKGFGGFIQKLYDLNSKGLEFEDTLFKNSAYKNAMEQYLTANGIETQEDIDNNRNLINNASLYAMEESLKSTFQQYSAFASSLNQLKHKNAYIEFGLDALMPFTKTPANILKTGASYSPLGLLKTIGYDTIQLKKGKISITTYIDNISQGLTGSGIVMLGYMLAQSGLIKAGGDDDKEDKYEQALGNQTYSIQIGNQNFTLDWLSPVAMPLFVGAELSNMKENGSDDTFNMNTITNMLTTTFDPMMQMSLLQGINNALSGFKENKLQAIVEESAKSYVGQLFPTLAGQFAKTIDPTIRSTGASKDSGWTLGEQILRSNMAKIPGLTYFLEPATDVWGNERQRSENIIIRAFENFIAPYSRKENIESGIDTELKRLYASTGADELIPTINLSKVITYKDEKYQTNSKEYTQFKKQYGTTASETLKKLFETNTYKNSSETEKINLIENAYTYAKEKSKQEFLNSQNVIYYNTTKDNEDIYRDNYITEVIKNDISYDSAKYKEQNPIKYNVITSFNVKYDDYAKYQKSINDIKDTYSGTKNTAIRKQKVWNYIENLKLSKAQKTMLYKSCGGYSIKDYESQMINYIKSLKIPNSEKEEIWKWLYS